MTHNPKDPHRDQPVLERGRPVNAATAAVILLHGRGASAEDILGLADEFESPDLAYLAPDAAANSWYPYSFLAPIEQNQPWLDSALHLVGNIVDRVIGSGIPRSKIAIAGFSQGACLATEFAVRNPGEYGGLIAFTGGLIGPPGSRFHYSGSLAGTNAYLGAGDPDAHVPWERVEETASVLSSLGASVTLRRYPGMPHTINRDEIAEARKIVSRLAADETGDNSNRELY
jgi:phospholipase/carboxylesterase